MSDINDAKANKDIKKDMSFEEALVRLEVIVKNLESGKAPLDESLALFEEGVTLVRLCNKKLDSAEKKVKILTENGEEDFIVKEG